jgi:hypothetical protein
MIDKDNKNILNKNPLLKKERVYVGKIILKLT